MPQRFSPDAVVALQDALAVVYFYKNDLRKFLQACGVDAGLIAQIDWDQYKRLIVSDLLDTLVGRGDGGLPALTKLCRDVASMESFAHLARLEDGDIKVREAEQAVSNLKRLVRTNRMVDEADAQKKHKTRRDAEIRETNAFRRRLGEIQSLFAQVSSNTDNPQQRGRDLETVMRDLFDLFDLDPRASFSLRGEQIDGAFTLDSTDFIFEAKWEKDSIARDDLDVFAAKVARRLDNTLGLFLSMNSFQPTASNSIHTTARYCSSWRGLTSQQFLRSESISSRCYEESAATQRKRATSSSQFFRRS